MVGFGLVLAFVRLILFFAQTLAPIFRDGAWGILTTPGSDAYHPLWAPLLSFELVGATSFIVAQFLLLTLFFRRSRWFPKAYVWVAALNLPYLLADVWLTSYILPEEPMFDVDTRREIGRAMGAVVVWIPYMLISKRVRNTFTVGSETRL